MTTIKQALFDCVPADLACVGPLKPLDEESLLDSAARRYTAPLAAKIADRFEVIAVKGDPSSDYQGVVFRDKINKELYVANRGTESLIDIVDAGHLTTAIASLFASQASHPSTFNGAGLFSTGSKIGVGGWINALSKWPSRTDSSLSRLGQLLCVIPQLATLAFKQDNFFAANGLSLTTYLDGGAGADWREGGQRDDTPFGGSDLAGTPTSIGRIDCLDRFHGSHRWMWGDRQPTAHVLSDVRTSSANDEHFAEAA